eukprot:scaffold124925_cov36-Phaeocystis_antarctica.AAC.1
MRVSEPGRVLCAGKVRDLWHSGRSVDATRVRGWVDRYFRLARWFIYKAHYKPGLSRNCFCVFRSLFPP